MEENVYEETTLTEDVETESENGAGRKDAVKNTSAVLGKFKDVDALARAYEALQAEFTRRSQRLKELERQSENSASSSEMLVGRLGAEKLRKNAKARKEETKRFDEFLLSTEEVGAGAFKTAEPDGNQPLENTTEKMEKSKDVDTMYEMKSSAEDTAVLQEGQMETQNVCAENEEVAEETAVETVLAKTEQEGGALPFVAKSENATVSSEALYEQVSRDENVRLRIIGEYLNSIGKPNAPLMTGGVRAMKTPPQKAGCVADAGNMALLYFQKTRAND